MTSKLTRERLQEIAEDGFLKHGESKELARMALAAMDSEPVAWTWHYREQWHVTNDERRAEFVVKDGDVAVLPLYRHAQPAQISEPVLPLQDKDLQGVIDALEHPAGINAVGKQVVRHALVEIQERRKADREPVVVCTVEGGQMCPDGFGECDHSLPDGTHELYAAPQPAPIVQMVQEEPPEHLLPKGNSRDTTYRRGAIILGWKLCRAAMLAAAPQEVQVVPEKIEQSRKRVDRCDVCTEGARGGCGTCIFNGNFE
ncbi:hypothetical protein [Klebsiella pneumoniae]|uniref:hypothetical protein n=1 Tax=Klebsiella pneumoniae TaxID=573 RepID=UPI0010D8F145|nr:hypothetical protein [Klebsiella pneumoniae]MDG3492510.1 hypothetical protein [Klebsiella pneumoniae]VGD35145.1 Uncharacterised protein [Klebsiella pneumoniae]